MGHFLHFLKLKCEHSPLNLRIYTLDGAGAKFTTYLHETDYSVGIANLANFLSISTNQTHFCRLLAWSQDWTFLPFLFQSLQCL